jgi:VanZ family protein
MPKTGSGATHARIIGAACICTLCVILAAGLWPFQAPKNDVSWSANENGLYFGRYGSILSVARFPDQTDNPSGSIELWLQPSVIRGAHTILSFDSSDHLGVPFSLRQLDDSLIVEQDNEDTNGNSWTAWSVVKGAFHKEKPAFVSVILRRGHTAVYLDGVFSRDTSIGDSWNNLTGRLIVANSPKSSDSWSGTIKGMAIYHRELTQGEILEHYESWTRNRRPNLTDGQAPVALYLFDERTGDTIHNEFDHRTDLKIPKRYFVLHPAFLESPWRSYHASWSYWGDVTVNIVGFIPFGLFTTAYFSFERKLKEAAAITIVVGFFTSLTIEILQASLPTRDSGMNDLITNTFGTAIGAMLYLWLGRIPWLTAPSFLTNARDHERLKVYCK